MFFFFNLFKYPFVSAFQKRFVDDKSENNLKFNLNQNCLRMILSVGVGMKFNKFEFVNVTEMFLRDLLGKLEISLLRNFLSFI